MARRLGSLKGRDGFQKNLVLDMDDSKIYTGPQLVKYEKPDELLFIQIIK